MSRDVNNKSRNVLYRAYMGMNPPSECIAQKKPVAEKLRIEDYKADDDLVPEFQKRKSKNAIINYGLSSDKPYRTIERSEIIDFYEEYNFVFFRGIFPRKWYEKKWPYKRDDTEKRYYNVNIAYKKTEIPAVAGFFDKIFYIPSSFLEERKITKEKFAKHYYREDYTEICFSSFLPSRKNDDYNSMKRPGARSPVKLWH